MPQHDEEKEHDKGFRIVDRRRFTSEGEVRTDAPAEVPRSEPARPDPRLAPSPTPEVRPRNTPSRDSAAPGRAPASDHTIDFITFAASLATNALAALGALPDEQARGLPKSPELAREYIEIIAMLQEKTRGNLTREEEHALQQLLTELRKFENDEGDHPQENDANKARAIA
jgi:hypothetical protein